MSALLAPAVPTNAAAAAAAPGAHDADARALGAALLDHVRAVLDDGAPADALGVLVPGLDRLRAAMTPAAWRAFAAECAAHPLAARLHEDPFTARAYRKPRGFAGDAGTLDLIYRRVPVPADTTPLGRVLYTINASASACASVRYRRDLLARAVDDAADRAPGRARVLAVACGHLRDPPPSAAVREGRLAAFHALDQDPHAIALVRDEHAARGVTALPGSVRDLITGAARVPDLTLAYAAGLYDYLSAPVAARLTSALFDLLAPGGRLVLANFADGLAGAGYMEAFMAWPLILRGDAEMRALADAVPAARVAATRLFRDPPGNVIYLEIERA